MSEAERTDGEEPVVEPVDADPAPPTSDNESQGAGDPGPPEMEYFEKGKKVPAKR